MSETFIYETTVISDWIDYNGHMQDAYYGLIFSFAVDAVQDAIGFDAVYRKCTGCTIYLLEDHRFFLKEVKLGAKLLVETVVLDSDDKRFHLHLTMLHDGTPVSINETMELHVNQHPMQKPCLRRSPNGWQQRGLLTQMLTNPGRVG